MTSTNAAIAAFPTTDMFLAEERNRAILVTAWITNGQLDASMDEIVNSIRLRRETLGVQRQAEMQPGDRVRFVRGKPKYIIGATGTVARKEDGKIIVNLDVQYRTRLKKYLRPDGTVAAPVGLLERTGLAS